MNLGEDGYSIIEEELEELSGITGQDMSKLMR
jgi:hypothetical protein